MTWDSAQLLEAGHTAPTFIMPTALQLSLVPEPSEDWTTPQTPSDRAVPYPTASLLNYKSRSQGLKKGHSMV